MIAALIMAGQIGDAQPAPLPWWFWVVIFLALVVILWWLWYQGLKTGAAVLPELHPAERGEPVTIAADDLKIIEGIGPKINTVLHGAGIRTFADLASADSGALKKILLEAGLRLADPTTWPRQAALARDGRLDDFKGAARLAQRRAKISRLEKEQSDGRTDQVSCQKSENP